MSLHDVMLSNDDLLAAIDLTVDFHGNEASVEEHGKVLLDVNRNHLCVQHEADLDQTEVVAHGALHVRPPGVP